MKGKDAEEPHKEDCACDDCGKKKSEQMKHEEEMPDLIGAAAGDQDSDED